MYSGVLSKSLAMNFLNLSPETFGTVELAGLWSLEQDFELCLEFWKHSSVRSVLINDQKGFAFRV